jgi:hypothetical protein
MKGEQSDPRPSRAVFNVFPAFEGSMNRRELLKFGGASIAAFATTRTFSGQEAGPGTSDFGFIMEPDYVARLNDATQEISHVSPLIIPAEFGSFLPALLSDYKPSAEEAETWFKSRFSTCCSGPPSRRDSSNSLDARSRVSFLGESFVADVAARISSCPTTGTAFLPKATSAKGPLPLRSQDELVLNIYSLPWTPARIQISQDHMGYRLSRATSSTPGLRSMADYGTNIFTSPVLRIFMAYPEVHPLVPCEYRDVSHLKFDAFLWPDCGDSWWNCQWRSGGTQICSLHVGTVVGMKCLVVFDSMHQWICVNTCNLPSAKLDFSTVTNSIQQALASTPVPGWLIPSLALLIAGVVITTGVVVLG